MSRDKTPGPGHTDSSNNDLIVTCGAGRDVVTIRRDGAIVLITVEAEVAGAALIQATKQAAERGILRSDLDVLVDTTTFVGAIDWGAIHTVRDMKLWDQPRNTNVRVGFLVRDSTFASLVTLAGALFPRTAFRLFTDRSAALTWLSQPSR